MDDFKLFELAGSNEAGDLKESLRSGHNPNAIHTLFGNTLLKVACECDAIDSIRVLLEAGADPNLRFTFTSPISGAVLSDRVALMYAKSAQSVNLLHSHGAEINVADGEGWTPLAIAVDGVRIDAVAALLALGASRSLSGRISKDFTDVQELCDDRLKMLTAFGDPRKAAPMIQDLKALRDMVSD
jgi:ankyrin repeat protein